MRPEQKSQCLLVETRAKAKMFEYGIPEEHHVEITRDPIKLFTISIGLLGHLASAINRGKSSPNLLLELKDNLRFSALFFDAYIQSKLNKTLDPYFVLLGAASYYLCDLPGSASVLVKRVNGDCLDLEGAGLENLLLWLLKTDLSYRFNGTKGPFGKVIDEIAKEVSLFFKDGDEANLLRLITELRRAVYENGSPRQLLFGDLIAAVLRKKLENSCWRNLPKYSGLSCDKWRQALQKESFIKELWPAQHLLGRAGVLRGKSAIVQMPTSAGKTRATELILRSAFLAERLSLAIIIAPFRALCHEIKESLVEAFLNEPIKVEELSDVPQIDFEIAKLIGHKQILVITPEKFLYAFRHVPELVTHAGLFVFDEGHQFDSGTRGITYELLLTSLQSKISKEAQKILISAVISNAEDVGEWLNGDPCVIKGTNKIPTYRSVGFTSWLDYFGKIEYVNSSNIDQREFFVPRAIKRFELKINKGERKVRLFPDKKDGQTVALFLGLKLISNGSIAIFCGQKPTALSICKKAVDVIERGVPMTLPVEISDSQEVERIRNLYVKNLGVDAPSSQCAKYGIFAHHGNTPHGIRLAVEYAMRENLIRFVVCTSTLAQGVNLPLRYLIVTNVNQGKDCIKVRDFQNLIGRVGRAGMHTEGSIIFADQEIFDNRESSINNQYWRRVKELLVSHNSEPCLSNLLSFFEPIKSANKKFSVKKEALNFVEDYINNQNFVSESTDKIIEKYVKMFSRDDIKQQIEWRMNLIYAVESFLLSHCESEQELTKIEVIRLAKGTLAYFLADKQTKEHICELFLLLADNISKKIRDPVRRKVYGRTLYGLQDSQTIERWVQSNSLSLFSIVEETDILDLVWPLFTKIISKGVFAKFNKPQVLKEIAHGWIAGKSFCELLKVLHNREAKMIWGTKQRKFQIDNVVDICERALAYDGTLVVSAICEFVEALNQNGTKSTMNRLKLFQKRLKFGLPTETTIILYELGFSDRFIAQDLAYSLDLGANRKEELLNELNRKRDQINEVVKKYPRYFQNRMIALLQ